MEKHITIYAYTIHEDGTATLSKMSRETVKDKWDILNLETGSKKDIIEKCKRLNGVESI